MSHRIFPLSESAVTIEFGNKISPELNDRAIKLADALAANPFPGFIEAAPAYSSVTVFFDLSTVRRTSGAVSAFEFVRESVETVAKRTRRGRHVAERVVDIPLMVGKEFSLDLQFIADENGLSPDDVIEIFLSRTYRVYMLGFLPGFAYMGDVDERIATGRRATPRLAVPKGSVAIAGRQTGIYSLESPGGWQIIGRTPVEMFVPSKKKPCLVEPGDAVRFVFRRA